MQAAQQAASQEEEEEDTGPLMVEELEQHGVNTSDVTKLKSAGFFTLDRYATTTARRAIASPTLTLTTRVCFLTSPPARTAPSAQRLVRADQEPHRDQGHLRGESSEDPSRVQKGTRAPRRFLLSRTTLPYRSLSSPPPPFFLPPLWQILPMGFTTAKDHAIEREQTVFIATGAKELDTLLQGASFVVIRHSSAPPPRSSFPSLPHAPAHVPFLSLSLSLSFLCVCRRHGDGVDHGDLRRVPHRQDADGEFFMLAYD